MKKYITTVTEVYSKIEKCGVLIEEREELPPGARVLTREDVISAWTFAEFEALKAGRKRDTFERFTELIDELFGEEDVSATIETAVNNAKQGKVGGKFNSEDYAEILSEDDNATEKL